MDAHLMARAPRPPAIDVGEIDEKLAVSQMRLEIANEFGHGALEQLDEEMDKCGLATYVPARSKLLTAGFLAGARFAEARARPPDPYPEEYILPIPGQFGFRPPREPAPVPVGDAAALALVGTSLGCLNLGLKVLEAIIDATHAKGDRK